MKLHLPSLVDVAVVLLPAAAVALDAAVRRRRSQAAYSPAELAFLDQVTAAMRTADYRRRDEVVRLEALYRSSP